MFVQTKAEGLSFEDLLKVAHRRNNEAGHFPYAVQTARCSNCRYCQEGKCSLKECSRMERIARGLLSDDCCTEFFAAIRAGFLIAVGEHMICLVMPWR